MASSQDLAVFKLSLGIDHADHDTLLSEQYDVGYLEAISFVGAKWVNISQARPILRQAAILYARELYDGNSLALVTDPQKLHAFYRILKPLTIADPEEFKLLADEVNRRSITMAQYQELLDAFNAGISKIETLENTFNQELELVKQIAANLATNIDGRARIYLSTYNDPIDRRVFDDDGGYTDQPRILLDNKYELRFRTPDKPRANGMGILIPMGFALYGVDAFPAPDGQTLDTGLNVEWIKKTENNQEIWHSTSANAGNRSLILTLAIVNRDLLVRT